MSKPIHFKDVIHLNDAANLLQGSIYIKDLKGIYLNCNQFQAQMAGFDSPEDIIGKTDYDLPWKKYADAITSADKRIMTSGVAEELEEVGYLPNGSEIIMLSRKSPLYDATGKIIGLMGVSLDITERKNAEERERAALAEAIASEEKRKAAEEVRRALMVLAGSIAHDLRTPLYCLRSNNNLLEKCLPILLECYRYVKKSGIDVGIQPTGRVGEWIEKQIPDLPAESEQFIAKMYTFIDDNLKAIKMSTSNNLTTNDLVGCKSYKEIENALNIYPFQENERQLIEWERSYYFDFLGNPILFMRIIFNLLSNAIYQINKNGKGKIFISSEEQPGFNAIRFKDTGGGAPADIVGHIFEGYKTTKAEGTGVGLAFCKLTMQSFGGDITCHSVEGDYIEFLLIFPKIKQDEI